MPRRRERTSESAVAAVWVGQQMCRPARALGVASPLVPRGEGAARSERARPIRISYAGRAKTACDAGCASNASRSLFGLMW
jgi:hypothetical protein